MSSTAWCQVSKKQGRIGPSHRSWWRALSRCRGRWNRCLCFGWKGPMDGREPGLAEREAEDGLSPWPLWLAWLLVVIGVGWCWYATWYETLAVSSVLDRRVGDLGLGVDSVVSKWMPAAAASGSLVIALAKMITGRGSVRFLLTAGGLVGIKALTLGIEALIRS